MRFIKNISTIMSRMNLFSKLGLSFDGKRDLYKSCGYPQVIEFQDYYNVYSRGDIGKTIVSAFPDATWVQPPVVRESQKVNETSTAFEEDWNELIKSIPLFLYFNRADTLCGIGSFGGLFLGFDDGKDFSKPCTKANRLLYLKPLAEGSIKINSIVTDEKNPRFGFPEYYQVVFGNVFDNTSTLDTGNRITKIVHWSRMLHLADNTDESDIYGVPRMKPVFNRLMDCRKVLGCSAEMFWQGAFQGLAFEADPDVEVVNKEEMEEEIEKYVNGLQRYLQLQGIKTNTLSSPVANPKATIDTQLLFISATTRIPLRVLTGSERGELSSVQDESNWRDRVGERINGFGLNSMLKPFIKRMIDVGVLRSPEKGENEYFIEFNDVSATTFKQQMEISRIITDALRMYVTDKLYHIMPPDQYLEKVMKFSPAQIREFMPFSLEELDEENNANPTGIRDEKFDEEGQVKEEVPVK